MVVVNPGMYVLGVSVLIKLPDICREERSFELVHLFWTECICQHRHLLLLFASCVILNEQQFSRMLFLVLLPGIRGSSGSFFQGCVHKSLLFCLICRLVPVPVGSLLTTWDSIRLSCCL